MRIDAETIRTKKDNPCFKCENRAVGCHSTCQEYLLWVEEYRAKKSEIQAERAKEDDINEYSLLRTIRAKKVHQRLEQYKKD